VNQQERRDLENWLMTHGLDGCINDPEKLQVFADLVSQWPGDKHDFLRDLLNECDVTNRYDMYQALAPRLKFKALSFSQYEAQIALKAGQMVSQKLMRVEGNAAPPIEINGHKVQITEADKANSGWCIVRCHVCDKIEKFLADTPVGAIIAARKAGWVRAKGIDKETCSECWANLAVIRPTSVFGPKGILLTSAATIDRRRVN
jgi:hypothetical protein